MEVIRTSLEGVLILQPRVFPDQRGFFLENYNEKTFRNCGIDTVFVQDNHSRSSRGTLRGLHYQTPPHAQVKLVRVSKGEVFDVAVDLRKNSPTFGKWFGTVLSDENMRMMYIPQGFAHGFCVLSDVADFCYKCSDFYAPETERGIFWNDPEVGVEWPIESPVLSARDEQNPLFQDVVDFF